VKTYIPTKPCKRGHSLRYVKGKVCVECQRIHSAAWAEKNYELKLVRTRERKRRNPEPSRAAAKRWREANPEKVKLHKQLYKYPAMQSARSRKYALSKRHATPAWLTAAEYDRIAALYVEAARLTRETGVIHHVDHYYPLQGEAVSGLHVPENLQIIPAKENRRKSNQHPDLH
jgi:hypothetical protein